MIYEATCRIPGRFSGVFDVKNEYLDAGVL